MYFWGKMVLLHFLKWWFCSLWMRQRSMLWWNYLSGVHWKSHSIASLMWLAGHFRAHAFPLLCSWSRKWVPCYCQGWRLYSNDLHFRLPTCLRGDAHRLTAGPQTNTHAMCRGHVIHWQEAEIHKHTYALSVNKEPTVCGGRMNRLHCIITMSHPTVINEKRMKVLTKREICRHETCLKTKRWDIWQECGAALSLQTQSKLLV